MSQPDTEDNQPKKSSPRRIAASRANGAQSTGATTPEGRRACAEAAAKSSTKHGLLARTILLPGESLDRFNALVEAFTQEHAPITQSEQVCVQKMAAAYWRQVRAWSFQSMDFSCEMSRQSPSAPDAVRAVAAFRILCRDSVQESAHRYETAYDRQFYRALRELDALKAKRGSTVDIPSTPNVFAPSTWEHSEPSDAIPDR